MSNDESLATLLGYLRVNRGFDFQGYRPSSLLRRIEKRMQLVGVDNFAAYIDRLEVSPDEFHNLFNTILINVTSFFRDDEAWGHLRALIEERILPGAGPDSPLRVWSAGCASGEEAYSLAILLAELLGIERFGRTTKIYATDIDEDALDQARLGAYTQKEVSGMPPGLLEKYFECVGDRYVVNKDLRRCVVFGRHNLLQDAPILHIDVLACRNTLMYFNADVQSKSLADFHFALKDQGILFLGKAEMMASHGALFSPIDLKHRLFARVPRGRKPGRVALGGHAPAPQTLDLSRLREASFELAHVAQIVVDPSGKLSLCSELARSLFGLRPHDQGRPFAEIDIALQGELRACCERVIAEHRPLICHDIDWKLGDSVMTFDAQLLPLLDASGALIGVHVTFLDVSLLRRLQTDLQWTKGELETSNEELHSAGEELLLTSQELQSTGEKLQSTNQELRSTNQELQSTNQELKSLNEELQSTNEELQLTNGELREQGDELKRANSLLKLTLDGMRIGVAVLDHDLVTVIWSHRAEDLWGVGPREVVGKPFLSLDTGLPVDQLEGLLRACNAGEAGQQRVVLDATNRHGKAFRCKVSCSALPAFDKSLSGILLLMEEIPAGGPDP